MLKFLTRRLRCFLKQIEVRLFNKVWHFVNIYPTAQIGVRNSIGSYTEIGDNVSIGNDNRIGAHVFIPNGVVIGNNCFIGPNVTFTNDKYPPSGSENWEITIVSDNASIGAGCVILPGVFIGRDAKVGAGSVVTHNVPVGEVWYGVPAKRQDDFKWSARRL